MIELNMRMTKDEMITLLINDFAKCISNSKIKKKTLVEITKLRKTNVLVYLMLLGFIDFLTEYGGKTKK